MLEANNINYVRSIIPFVVGLILENKTIKKLQKRLQN